MSAWRSGAWRAGAWRVGSWLGDVLEALRPAGADDRRRKRVVLWGRTYRLGSDGVYRELEQELRRKVRRRLQIEPGEPIGVEDVPAQVERAVAPLRRDLALRAPDLLPLLDAVVAQIQAEEEDDVEILLMAA